MSTKAQVKTQAKTPAAPATARIPQPHVVEPEHEAERPDITAQLEGAARLGHSLGAVGVDSPAPPIIQRQEIPEEEEEELQLKRAPAAIQRQELPEEEEEELMMKRDDQRVGPQGGQVPPEVEAAIQRARGGGQPLEGAVQKQMSEALGHDFSGVRVHTDAEADTLNQQLRARAFTTGRDVFFRQGEYNPSRSSGRELLAHELTHVVQQAARRVGGGGSGMTVRPGGDAFEHEADVIAGSASPATSVGTLQREAANPAMDGIADISGQRRWVGPRGWAGRWAGGIPYWRCPTPRVTRTVGVPGLPELVVQRVVDDSTADQATRIGGLIPEGRDAAIFVVPDGVFLGKGNHAISISNGLQLKMYQGAVNRELEGGGSMCPPRERSVSGAWRCGTY